jgi:hypothetical protein
VTSGWFQSNNIPEKTIPIFVEFYKIMNDEACMFREYLNFQNSQYGVPKLILGIFRQNEIVADVMRFDTVNVDNNKML